MAVTIKSAISSVKWDKFGEHMLRIYTGIYEHLQYTDCELILSDGHLRASRMVLGMASSFFENIFQATANQPVSGTDPLKVIIPDVTVGSMQCVLQFIYTGEVKLRAEDMSLFLDACYLLQIRGVNSNDGRVQGASIVDQSPATFELSDNVTQKSTSSSTSYLMSVVHSDAADRSVLEVEQNQAFGSSIEQIVFQGTVVREVHEDSFQNIKDHAVEDQSCAEYYDLTEDDGPQQDGADDATDEQPFDETVNLSCIEKFMTDELEDMETAKADSGTVDKESCKDKESTALSYAERLEKAVDAVVNSGASFRQAAVTYNIPKTVLWRKTVKIARPAKPHQYEFPSPRREAMEAIKAGEKLLNVSRRFDIPISTLHRDKIRLYSEGELPDTVALKQRDKGDTFKQRVIEAAQKCLSGSMSLSEAARKYSLPKTTIWRKIGLLKEEPLPANEGSQKRGRAKAGGKSGTSKRNSSESYNAGKTNVDAGDETTKSKVQHNTYVFM
ncbi:modifier of mdg4 [Anopheles ziemanni]|uniref:modifier of mdg4 n=1 Tax=Anopheles coustani TaxID=139045 RepID=UPI00265940E9|nr:modifier of mdg4 [Anopheles coustani]XP_058178392.1 modifier of mdg4 [Anopheles ziemanni]